MSSNSGLTIAVPSKGRLEEITRDMFAASNLTIHRPGGARSYQGHMDRQPEIVVRFYPASDIAREVVRGTIHLGVTGADLVHEVSDNAADSVVFARPLGYGHADVVVAVPECWIDVVQMVDLADVAADFRARHKRWLRVATKYVNLTRRHFAQHGISEYRIVESLGATEAAPASGAADLIVDITSSGSTLAANALKILEDGVILKSEAHLMVSRKANWTPLRKARLEALMSILGGVEPGISVDL